MNQQPDDVKTKSKKANDIVRNCVDALGKIRKKQHEVIGKYNNALDKKKIDETKKQIEAL